MGYDRGDSFTLDFEAKANGIPFGSKSKLMKSNSLSSASSEELCWINSSEAGSKIAILVCQLAGPAIFRGVMQ